MASDLQHIWGDEPMPLMPYTPAVKAGDWVFMSGQLATDFKTGITPEGGGGDCKPLPREPSGASVQGHFRQPEGHALSSGLRYFH